MKGFELLEKQVNPKKFGDYYIRQIIFLRKSTVQNPYKLMQKRLKEHKTLPNLLNQVLHNMNWEKDFQTI